MLDCHFDGIPASYAGNSQHDLIIFFCELQSHHNAKHILLAPMSIDDDVFVHLGHSDFIHLSDMHLYDEYNR